MDTKVKSLLEAVLCLAVIAGIAIGTPKALIYVMGTKYPVAAITSGSMWPTLKRGDVVLIRKVERADLKLGDIVVYRNSKQGSGENTGFTIHRITELNQDELITRGDANNVADIPIGYDSVVGRAMTWGDGPIRIPQIGKLTIWISEMRK